MLLDHEILAARSIGRGNAAAKGNPLESCWERLALAPSPDQVRCVQPCEQSSESDWEQGRRPFTIAMTLKGHLLVASPKLADPNFNQSVVLIVQHTEAGALGLVLNRPTSTTLDQFWEKISPAALAPRKEPIYRGGPCKGPLMALHTAAEFSETEIVSGVYFSADAESLEQLVSRRIMPVRFFIGCAGWGEQQLEQELAANIWATLPASYAHVLAPSAENRWQKALRELTGRHMLEQIGIKGFPADSALN